jgi:hypothetical protein
MTRALQDAFDAAARLPDQQQDALAAAILEDLALEQQWEARLASKLGRLERLADEALADHAGDRSLPLDPEKL